jgi:uncharacterized membrane protein (GlpM family)
MNLALKSIISALLIVLITELSKRSTLFGGLVASLPLLSVLSFCWLYYETRDVSKIVTLSHEIFWLVIPSLALFLVLPLLLKKGVGFGISLLVACICTAALYAVTFKILTHFK